MTQPKSIPWEVTLRIDDKGLIRLVADIYAMSDEPTKAYIETELRRLIGQTVDSALKNK